MMEFILRKEVFIVLLEDFKKLNLQTGQKIRIKYNPMWSKKEINQRWIIDEIKMTVLSPTRKELCLYNTDGGFLALSSIKEIKVW